MLKSAQRIPKEQPFSEMNFSKQLCVSLWIETILRKEKLQVSCHPPLSQHLKVMSVGLPVDLNFESPKKRRSIARRASKTTKGAKGGRKFWDVTGWEDWGEQIWIQLLDGFLVHSDWHFLKNEFLNSHCYHESLAVLLWCTSFIDGFM